ncbi:MAG: Fic family protein [Chitinophagales bacterium]
MIEKPPQSKELTTDITIQNMVDIDMAGVLKKIQDNYLYWDKVKYQKSKLSATDLWFAVKLHRRLKSNILTFGKYQFSYIVTDFMQQTLHHFDLNIGGSLTSNIGIAETDKNKFIISSLIEESISSSQIEGAVTTRKKAKEMLQKERKPINKSEQMIMNNYITMRKIVQIKDKDLSEELLLNIHKLITNSTLDNKNEEGKFRESNEIHVVNSVTGEIAHTPPDYTELKKLIKDLCTFFNKENATFIHPIVKASIIHFLIGWIHPFVDGNGRTARALFYWYMLKKGYWLTEFLSISRIIKDSKKQYENAFIYTELDNNDMGYFISYQLKTMQKAFESLKAYINLKQKEVFQSARFLKIPNVNERMAQILKLLYDDGDRILDSKFIENRFKISNFTARSDLKTLVQLGFLESVQVNKKKHNYIKSKQFEKQLRKHNV